MNDGRTILYPRCAWFALSLLCRASATEDAFGGPDRQLNYTMTGSSHTSHICMTTSIFVCTYINLLLRSYHLLLAQVVPCYSSFEPRLLLPPTKERPPATPLLFLLSRRFVRLSLLHLPILGICTLLCILLDRQPTARLLLFLL